MEHLSVEHTDGDSQAVSRRSSREVIRESSRAHLTENSPRRPSPKGAKKKKSFACCFGGFFDCFKSCVPRCNKGQTPRSGHGENPEDCVDESAFGRGGGRKFKNCLENFFFNAKMKKMFLELPKLKILILN